jgi:hypothetical protein
MDLDLPRAGGIEAWDGRQGRHAHQEQCRQPNAVYDQSHVFTFVFEEEKSREATPPRTSALLIGAAVLHTVSARHVSQGLR